MNWDPDAARIATRTCLAFGLALAAALYLDWPVTPAVITTQMLQAALFGIAVRNSISRFVAAVFAGFLSLLILGVFPQDRFMIVLCYAALISFVVYRFQGSKNPYLWVITSALISVIGLSTAGNPQSTWTQAVHISSSFMLGGVAVILVDALVWPNPVRKAFEGALAATLQAIGKQFELRRAVVSQGDTTHAADVQKIQGQELKSAAMLPVLLANAAVESRQIDRFQTRYEHLVNDMVVVGAEMISLGDMLETCLESETLRHQISRSEAFESGLGQFAQELDALARQAHAKRDGSLAIGEAPAPDFAEGIDVSAFSAPDRALFEALRDKASQAWSAIHALRVALANVENPKAPVVEPLEPPKPEPFSFPLFFSSFRFRWSVVAGIASFCGVYLWLLTQWPNGFRIGLFVPVLGCLLAKPWPGQRLAILTGLGLAIAESWVLYFAVMPTLPDDFWFLWPTMMVFLFPLVYLQALKKPFLAMAGFIGGMAFCMLVGVSHFQQYSFSSYMNVMIGLGGAILFGMAFYSLFIWSRTEKDFQLGLEAFFRLCHRTLLDFENIAQMPDALGRLRTRRKALIGAYQKCAGLANRLPYSKVPQNDKEKVGALLESLWTVAFRLDTMLRARARLLTVDALAANQGADGRAALADAMDALQLAAKQGDTVAQWPLDPAQHPEHDQALQTLSSSAEQGPPSTVTIGARLALAGFHRALTESVEAARQRFNRLDWKAWSFERF